ncbi:glycosyl transferase family 2 [Paenibacillus curdlanolyticus YK9]|uniref:Glycosyl transferase family 2 n=1 Tax=Paenibacillus curdlanolyticus YK9 TaxID=717606 RepID=E0IEU1_9BACL|nr:glycosyltransferase family 2 protein [Paenibacillus curdlanolyticus]EFM09179.1 glycosyl transferase family 2 [Paenibacillus curdlanolyticus YK9]
MLLGVHLIVRNEAERLGGCLDSVWPWADELVIVDTGSTDATVQLAASYGARIVTSAWADDFAQARNIGLGQARTRWVLVLDADERVGAETDWANVRKMLLASGETAYRVMIENALGGAEGDEQPLLRSEAIRLFRADLGYQYVGAIHEQLAAMDGSGRLRDVDGPLAAIRLMHTGYSPALMAQKRTAERNGRIIREQLVERADDPFYWYNLGVTCCQQGEAAEASVAFARARMLAAPDAPYRPSLILDSARAMLAQGKEEEALALLGDGVQRYPNYADMQLLHGRLLERHGAWDEAKQAYFAAIAAGAGEGSEPETALTGGPAAIRPAAYITEAGAGGYQACTAFANLARRRGDRQTAAHYFERALVEQPGWQEALDGLAELLHEAGAEDAAIARTIVAYAGEEVQAAYEECREQQRGHGMSAADGKRTEAGHGDIRRQERAAAVAQALTGIGAYSAALPLWRLAGVPFGANGAVDTEGATAGGSVAVGESAKQPLHGVSRQELYAACLIRSGQYREAATWLYEQAYENNRCLSHSLGLDAALCCWMEGTRLSEYADLFLEEGTLALCMLAERVLLGHSEEAGTDMSGGESNTELAELMDRAVSHGLLRLALRWAAAREEAFAVSLHRHGYTEAAAERLLQRMAEGRLAAPGYAALGEMLYDRKLYGEALALFERAIETAPADERARLGAAAACMQLATEALIEREADRSAAAWLQEDRRRLASSAARLEGLGWRTVRTGAQRRRMRSGGAHEADFLMHDRQE